MEKFNVTYDAPPSDPDGGGKRLTIQVESEFAFFGAVELAKAMLHGCRIVSIALVEKRTRKPKP